jgi:hypothetical protein
MPDELLPALALVLLLLIGAVTILLVLRDAIWWRRKARSTARSLAAVICSCLSVLALAFLYVPTHARSTGADCMWFPTTEVLGFAGSAEAVREVPDDVDRTSTRECVAVARRHLGISSAVLVGSLVVYVVVRRRAATLALNT